MSQDQDFVKYEKLLIFGTKSSGKSTLSYYLEKNNYNEEKPTPQCKYIVP